MLRRGAGWRTLRRVSETPDSPASDGPRDAEDPRAWLGARLDDRYELTGYIGSGSIGHVYRARDHRLEFREVAITILKPGLREDQIARFKREALLTGGLSSPHLVPVTDFSTTPDARDYIVMELLRGEPLNAKDGIWSGVTDPKQRDAITVPFLPLRGSRTGELTARFDLVVGAIPEM